MSTIQSLTKGPEQLAIPYIAQIKAEKFALRSNETTVEMMMKDPDKTPAPPNPAIARPTMNIAELSAAPQSREPISNRLKPNRKTHLCE
jgi:hypothetical protein